VQKEATMTLTLDPIRKEPCHVIGAVALDLIAAIAGPASAPDHARAWSAAFELVTGSPVEQQAPA
jgi:hypothetical protein